MRLSCSLIVKGFPKLLREKYGNEEAGIIWDSAQNELEKLNKEESRKDKYAPYIFPLAAVYLALSKLHPEDAVPLIDEYGDRMGNYFKKKLASLTSLPGIQDLLRKTLPSIAKHSSAPGTGYERQIISDTKDYFEMNLTDCPLFKLSNIIGVPQACRCICHADKIYAHGAKGIRVERTMALGDGDPCCDYKYWLSNNS